MMEWGAKFNFVWLWTLPFALFIFFLAKNRKKSAMRRFGDLELVQRLAASFNPSKRRIKHFFILLALASIVLALAQPHFRQKEITLERKGVDILILVDVSQSMMAKDVQPNRLEKTKLELASLVDRLKNNRIGVVAFAGDAFIQCPLTIDLSAVKLFLSTLNPNLIPTPGTAIGTALSVGIQAFPEEKDHKAIVLLTDGEDHQTNPIKQAKLAKEKNITIFTIGIGTSDGATVPLENQGQGFKKDRQGQVVLSKLDEGLLKEIARLTGGQYFRASRAELEVEGIAAAVRQMTQKGLSQDKFITYEESFQFFLILALLFLMLEMVMSERRGFFVIFLLCGAFLSCGFDSYGKLKNEQGTKQYDQGKIGKATAAYESAAKAAPAVPEIAYNLGNAYHREGSFKESMAAYEKAARAEKNPQLQAQAFYNLGNSLFRAQELDKAKTFYEQALRLNPRDEDAKFNLELLLKKQDQQKQDQQKDQKQDQQKDQQKKDQQQGGGQSDQKDQNQPKQDQQGGQQDQQGGQQDQKKDQQNQQDPAKDPADSPGGENSSGEQDKKEQQKQDQQQGEGPQKPEGQDQEKGDQPSGGGGQESDKKEDQEPEGGAGGGQGDQNQQSQQEDEQPGEGQKTPEQIQAEQILNAIENQEKRIIRQQGGEKMPVRRSGRYVEKDW